MAEPEVAAEYAIVFRGRLVDGADASQVRANLARLFNADAARVEKMFGGQAVVIKKGLAAADAAKYRAVLAQAGAVVEAVAMNAVAAPAQAASVPTPTTEPTKATVATSAASTAAAAPSAPTALQQADAARAPSAAVLRAQSAPPQALATSMAEPGAILIEPVAIAPPAIDTSHLSVAEVGVDLIQHERAAEPHYDLSSLTLAPPGVTLVEAQPVTAPEFDLSALSMVPSGAP